MYEKKMSLPLECGLTVTKEVLGGKWKANRYPWRLLSGHGANSTQFNMMKRNAVTLESKSTVKL